MGGGDGGSDIIVTFAREGTRRNGGEKGTNTGVFRDNSHDGARCGWLMNVNE